MDTRVAAVTVRVVDPLTVPERAPTVVVPTLVPVASPPLEMVATPGDEELHVTVLVRFWVLLSVYVPVAVNCWFVPDEIDGFAGVTAIDTKVAAVTVRVVDPLTAPELAPTVVVRLYERRAGKQREMVATPCDEEL